MEKTIIRKAKKDDMSAVHALIHELAVYEKEADQHTLTVEELKEDGFGEQPLFNCFVAEKGTEIIGFALYYTSYSTWKGKCLYLEDLLVTADERRNGVGGLLFDKLIETAKEEGAARFEWQVLDWNEPAVEFYKKYKANLDPDWINGKIFL